MKKILLLILLILSAFSCGKKENPDTSANKEETVKKEKVEETEKTKEKSVEEQIKEMVNIWNEASSNADFDTLEKINHLLQKPIIFQIRKNFLKKILFMDKK